MFERIVVGIDTEHGRAERVVNAAEVVARAAHSEVLVAHVQELELEATLATTPRAGAVHPMAVSGRAVDVEIFVDKAVERLRSVGINARGAVEPGAGSTAKELLKVAETFGASLIVVGDRGQRVTDMLLGGVTQKVLRDAACSVLLVR